MRNNRDLIVVSLTDCQKPWVALGNLTAVHRMRHETPADHDMARRGLGSLKCCLNVGLRP
jgi:hypothetical protein